MKYDVHDGEIMIHQRDHDIYLPLSIAEMQHVVDTMNATTLTEAANKQYEAEITERVEAYFARIKREHPEMHWAAPTGMIERAEALLDDEPKPE